MSLKSILGERSGEDDGHWMSVSDLMAGLMIIFLFILIAYIKPIIETEEKIREIVVAWNESEVDIYEALSEEFGADLEAWGAEIEKETLSIRFNAPRVMFTQSSAEIPIEFQGILVDFFPRYIQRLKEFQPSISEIRIEGHTSSEWNANSTVEEAYFGNMDLSQRRTRTVLQFSLAQLIDVSDREWARNTITANGMSSSRLMTIEGTDEEDKESSRRVEFRVVTNTKQQIVKVLETVQSPTRELEPLRD